VNTPLLSCLAAVFLALVAGCTTYSPRIPGHYEDQHISFNFPEHWKITLREVNERTRSLILEPPHQGLVFIKGYPASTAPSLREFAREFSRAAASQTQGASLSTNSLREVEDGSLEERFDLKIKNTTVPHLRRYYRREGANAVYFIVTHVPVEDLESTRSGFVGIARDFRVKPTAGSN